MYGIDKIGSIPTPLGELICEQWNGPDYPCFDIVLKRSDGAEILLAVVEHEQEANCINIRAYSDMADDEPTHNGTITAEAIERYVDPDTLF